MLGFTNMKNIKLNCGHQDSGFCMACFVEMALEHDYLLFFRHNADFGPSEGDVIHYLNEQYMEESGRDLPKGWRRDD